MHTFRYIRNKVTLITAGLFMSACLLWAQNSTYRVIPAQGPSGKGYLHRLYREQHHCRGRSAKPGTGSSPRSCFILSAHPQRSEQRAIFQSGDQRLHHGRFPARHQHRVQQSPECSTNLCGREGNTCILDISGY